MLTLYRDSFWISPYVFSCFVALREKGLAFDAREIKLQDKEQEKPGYAARSITARLPSLDHDGFSLAESSAIVEYLEDAFPDTPRVLPSNARDRARARQIMSWIRSDDTLPIREERSTNTMFYAHADKPLSGAAKRAADKLVAVAERTIRGACLFDAWCIADADLAFILHRLILNGDPVPERVRAYAEAQWKRPSVHEFVAIERGPYIPYA